jgi:hypothetical protein
MSSHLQSKYSISPPSLYYYFTLTLSTAVQVTVASHTFYMHDHDWSQRVYSLYSNTKLQYYWSIYFISFYYVIAHCQPLQPETTTTIPALPNKKVKIPTSSPSTPTHKPPHIMLNSMQSSQPSKK